MRKTAIATVAVMAAVLALSTTTVKAQEEPGGLDSFLIGCCFGMRTGADYNDGKILHLRDWGRIIPYANIVFAVWDGVDCYEGIGRDDLRQKYGAEYY